MKYLPLPLLLLSCSLISACNTDPVPGPDKQFAGSMQGALTGAGAGAVTGFQVSAATGPGALVGAGVGALTGGIEGFGQDATEAQTMAMQKEIASQRSVAYAQQVLSEHYKRRAELHPTRDIFPADLFFYGDQTKLRPGAVAIIRELARINKTRLPYSRLVVAVYAKSIDKDSAYAQHLTERRAREIVDSFVRAGIEPRRLQTRPVVVTEPLLLDPSDRPERYNQAVELIALDR